MDVESIFSTIPSYELDLLAEKRVVNYELF